MPFQYCVQLGNKSFTHFCHFASHFAIIDISYSEISKGGNYKMSAGYNYGAGFALIVVLFILLIIIGASWGYGY